MSVNNDVKTSFWSLGLGHKKDSVMRFCILIFVSKASSWSP